jgi:hypothetical protein
MIFSRNAAISVPTVVSKSSSDTASEKYSPR